MEFKSKMILVDDPGFFDGYYRIGKAELGKGGSATSLLDYILSIFLHCRCVGLALDLSNKRMKRRREFG